MSVYIVIPVHNRRAETRHCLASLQVQDNDDFTVIVVDDGSTDGTSEMIIEEYPEVVLLHGNGDLWWVGSINAGIRYALDVCNPDDYVVSLNNDLTVPPNYVSSLLKAARQHERSIIGSVETTIADPRLIKSGGSRVNWKTAKYTNLNVGHRLDEFPREYTIPVSKLVGRGTIFPSEVFRKVGLFDEIHFKQCGDAELPLRAHFKYGYQLLVSYAAVVMSCPVDENSINDRLCFTLADLREYFFGIRSHHRIEDHFWIAYQIAPNWVWFCRYFTFDLLRNIAHFLLRLRVRARA